MAGCGTENLEFEHRQGLGCPFSEAYLVCCPVGSNASFKEVRRSEREVKHSPPCGDRQRRCEALSRHPKRRNGVC